MTRGVLYLIWGDAPRASLARSIASLRHWHPELPHEVVEMPAGSDLRCKSRMYDLSPFDETLFLDADTTVLGKLDYGFVQAKQHGMALTISANPWQRRYDRLGDDDAHNDAVEYSSGVVFFSKQDRVTELFYLWERYTGVDSSTAYVGDDGVVRRQEHNDQALLTAAIHTVRFNPFVLPCNWNFVPKWHKQFFGPLKILHGYNDIPQSLLKWNEQQSGAVIGCATLA